MIPDSLQVLGLTYRVKLTKKLRRDNQAVNGYHDPEKQQIDIQENLPLEQQTETLTHEVLHALECAFDLDLEEREVKLLARGLMAFCKSNPLYVELLARVARDTGTHAPKKGVCDREKQQTERPKTHA
jgi:hypothetical protein